MKRVGALFLAVIMAVSLCACGEKELNPSDEIVGEWLWDTGIVTWHFIFNEDGTCHYYNANRPIKYSTYRITDDNDINVSGLNWDLYYEIKENTFTLYCADKGRIVRFVKNSDYIPQSLAFVELDENICEEIEKEIEEDIETDNYAFLVAVTLTHRELGLTFTDIRITKKQKQDPYTYIAYGIIYAEDNYGRQYKQDINIVYTAEKSEEEECGYELNYNLIFVG